jgi:ATPase subunit of ABC transporter with duplicated ATPase domains
LEAEDVTYKFSFPYIEELGVHGPILSLKDVAFGYEKSKMVVSNVNLRIDQDSRIAILGNIFVTTKIFIFLRKKWKWKIYCS